MRGSEIRNSEQELHQFQMRVGVAGVAVLVAFGLLAARFRKLLQETRNAENLPIKNRLSDEEVAKFAANRFRFEGVEIKARLFRQYPFGDVGSHALGYLGRINTQDQAKLEDDGVGANYRGTDYIGKAGV